MIPKTIKTNREQKEVEEEGYDRNESMLMTKDPVISTPTKIESLGLGYDSDATILMTGSPGLDTDTDSEVRMLGYTWDSKLKRREGEVPESYTANEESSEGRKLQEHDFGECTTVSRENKY